MSAQQSDGTAGPLAAVSRPRLEVLEGLRGWAAVWVMVGHVVNFAGIQHGQHFPSGGAGGSQTILSGLAGTTSVGVFMILSGFVIAYLLDSTRESYGLYITRRFLRLYPAFIVCVLIGTLLNWQQQIALAPDTLPWNNTDWLQHQYWTAGVHMQHLWENLVAHLVMLHGVVPESCWHDSTGALLGVGWSLSTEWQFYLVAPFLLVLFRTAWGRYVLFSIFSLCALLSLIPWFRAEFINENDALLIFRAHYFLTGALCYAVYQWFPQHGQAARPPWLDGSLALLFALAMFSCDNAGRLWFGVFTVILARRFGAGGRTLEAVEWIFTNKLAQYLGKISYSLYLFHCLAAFAVMYYASFLVPVMDVQWLRLLVVVGILTLSLVGSHILYHVVEVPGIHLGKWLARRHAAASRSAAMTPTLDRQAA